MKTLVIGAAGQLGTDVCRVFGDTDVHAADLDGADIALDITSEEAVRRLIVDELKPQVVINTAAAHNVPKCQQEPAVAFAVNSTAALYLAQACSEAGARLIHISTDYVFGYGGTRPYVESDLIAGLYLGGRVAKDKRLAGTSLTAAKSYVVSSVFTTALKQLTHRHRPYQDAVPDHANWEGPIAGIHYNSFSSGHSSAAFSLATVFAMEYSRTIWVPVLAYTLATGTAVSRLYDNKHWASDVVIGSAIGFVTGRFMWKQSRNGNSRLNILPSMGTQSGSVTFLYRIG